MPIPIPSAFHLQNRLPPSGKVYSDGRFEAIIEIWDKSLLSHDHLVLVVRTETRKDHTNTCLTKEVMGAARIN